MNQQRPPSPVRTPLLSPARLERGEHAAQQSRELLPVGRRQLREQRLLLLDEVGHGRVHDVATGRGESHEHATPIARVGPSFDEATALEPVDPVGHRARGDERLLHEQPRRELVGLARPAQGRQHVEGPALELVLREGRAPSEVEPPSEARHPGEHLERAHVEVRSLTTPGGDDLVDVVAAPRVLRHAINSSHHQDS